MECYDCMFRGTTIPALMEQVNSRERLNVLPVPGGGGKGMNYSPRMGTYSTVPCRLTSRRIRSVDFNGSASR